MAAVNKLRIKGSWNRIKGKLKQKFARLINDDPMVLEGRDDEILGRIQMAISRMKSEFRKVPLVP